MNLRVLTGKIININPGFLNQNTKSLTIFSIDSKKTDNLKSIRGGNPYEKTFDSMDFEGGKEYFDKMGKKPEAVRKERLMKINSMHYDNL